MRTALFRTIAVFILFLLNPSNARDLPLLSETGSVPEVHEHDLVTDFRTPRPFKPARPLAEADTSSTNYIRAWNVFTTIDDYRRIGKTNSLWDAHAIRAMELYCDQRSISGPPEEFARIHKLIAEQCDEAIRLGCDDPLVRYLHLRFNIQLLPNSSDRQMIKAYSACAAAMEKLDYSPVRKAYVNLRAAEAADRLTPKGGPLSPDLVAPGRFAVHHWSEALHDVNMPLHEAAEVTKQIWNTAKPSNVGRYDIEGLLLPTVQQVWGDFAFSYWLLGKWHTDKAWRHRGDGYADTVTVKGWEGFEENLALAEKYLRKGWSIDSSGVDIPIAMITVCMGRSHPRAEMEKWFEHAMAIDPACYEAASAKAYYLAPKWLGSERELIAFGRECVASKIWKGRIPLILRNAHHSLMKHHQIEPAKYLKRPNVWTDLQSSYEKYFELNPRNISWRYDFAKDAYQAAKYDIFLAQVKLIGEPIDYERFCSQDCFDEMLKAATDAVANRTRVTN